MQLGAEVDYRVLTMLFTVPPPLMLRCDLLGEPSMPVFYENLGRASRGEFWIWKHADAQHFYSVVPQSKIPGYHILLCAVLSYGCFGYLREMKGYEPDQAEVPKFACRLSPRKSCEDVWSGFSF